MCVKGERRLIDGCGPALVDLDSVLVCKAFSL